MSDVSFNLFVACGAGLLQAMTCKPLVKLQWLQSTSPQSTLVTEAVMAAAPMRPSRNDMRSVTRWTRSPKAREPEKKAEPTPQYKDATQVKMLMALIVSISNEVCRNALTQKQDRLGNGPE